MTTAELRGWQPDPFGLHEFRFFSDDGKPTLLVRDGGVRSYDQPPDGAPFLQPIEPVREPDPRPGIAFEVGQQPLPNGNAGSHAHANAHAHVPEPVLVIRPADPVRQLSPPMTRPTRYAFIAVLAAMTASALTLAVLHLEGHGSSPSAASTSSTSSPLRATTSTGGTKLTVALPAALKPTAAAAAFISSWAAGNRAEGLSVANPPAVATLFAGRYTPGLVVDRGCSVAFSPIVCTYGPSGGAAPTDPIYEIDVVQALGGWYVSSVTINN
jgi:hypothetical protein